MAHRYTSEEAARARFQKGAMYGNRTVIAQGRVPGAEARAARQENAMRRRLEKAIDAAPVNEAEVYTIQLRRIARAENHAPDQDDATAGLVIADGALLDVDE